MNGLDFEPGGVVDFDGTRRAVWFESGLTTVWLPGPKATRFRSACCRRSYRGRRSDGADRPVLAERRLRRRGRPRGQGHGVDRRLPDLRAKSTVVMTAGKSLVNGSAHVPRRPRGAVQLVKSGGYKKRDGESAKSFGVGFVATGRQRTKGWRAIDVSYRGRVLEPDVHGLKSVKASYDVPSERVESIGGSVEPALMARTQTSRARLATRTQRSDRERGRRVDRPARCRPPASRSSAASFRGHDGGGRTGSNVPGQRRGVGCNGCGWASQMQSLRDGTPFSHDRGRRTHRSVRELAEGRFNVPLLGHDADQARRAGDRSTATSRVSWSRMDLDGENDVLDQRDGGGEAMGSAGRARAACRSTRGRGCSAGPLSARGQRPVGRHAVLACAGVARGVNDGRANALRPDLRRGYTATCRCSASAATATS